MALLLPAYGFVFVPVVPEVVGSLWPDGGVLAGGSRLPVRDIVIGRSSRSIVATSALYVLPGGRFRRKRTIWESQEGRFRRKRPI